MKMSTIVGIFIFINWENFMLSWDEHEKKFYTFRACFSSLSDVPQCQTANTNTTRHKTGPNMEKPRSDNSQSHTKNEQHENPCLWTVSSIQLFRTFLGNNQNYQPRGAVDYHLMNYNHTSSSGGPLLQGADSFGCRPEKYDIDVLLPNSYLKGNAAR